MKKCTQCVACETIETTDTFTFKCHQGNFIIKCLDLASDCGCFELLGNEENSSPFNRMEFENITAEEEQREFERNEYLNKCGTIDLREFNGKQKENIISLDIIYLTRQMQLQRTIGELKALQASYYNPMGNNKAYYGISKMIEEMICKLGNELG